MSFIKIILILFIVVSPFCSAISLGISPEKIIFSAEEDKRACKNFSLVGDPGSVFHGEAGWSKTLSNNLGKYNLTSESLGISASFPETTVSGRHQICIVSKQSGTYYGALLYRLENSSYGIGTWILLDVSDPNPIKKVLSLTGSAVKRGLSADKIWISSVFLLTLLLVLLVIKAWRRKKDSLA
ncbi:MAG: hypothetical protein M1165_01710 [Candidatus Pacearchaeota archaeon]|nr:hypothetical protein [Candidatus Pacearchaeota archaeon]